MMNFIKRQERLAYLIELLKQGAVSSPMQIAQKFQVSEKTARNMINTLREQGNAIFYCHKTKKYTIKQ
ncbi:MAG: DeoR family transcriptional regulator [Bacteroidales bacterium]|nr:DeoR family transcriptional regulator [Bacteroidales bacterium]